MDDNSDNGVKINLISSRKLDSMSSEEKLRFILDEVKKGTVLVLERGLTATEEIDLIKATMSEINHDTFIGIEMQSYSSQELAAEGWLARVLGRSRVPKMSVIGPANLLKTIHKNGSMIQTMVLTGEATSKEVPAEEYTEEVTPGAELPGEGEPGPPEELSQDESNEGLPEHEPPIPLSQDLSSATEPEPENETPIESTQVPIQEPITLGSEPEQESESKHEPPLAIRQPPPEPQPVLPPDQPPLARREPSGLQEPPSPPGEDLPASQTAVELETDYDTPAEEVTTEPTESAPEPEAESMQDLYGEPPHAEPVMQGDIPPSLEHEVPTDTEAKTEAETDAKAETSSGDVVKEPPPDQQQGTGFLYKRLKQEEE